MEVRIPGRLKQLRQDAARLQGMSVSDFISSVAHLEAVRVLQQSAAIQLSHEASDRFVEALMSPPAPTGALRNGPSRIPRS